LWSLATHLFGVFDVFSYLAITSPTKRCGKSRVGELLESVCANPARTVGISAAALYRLVDQMRPTLITDEAESLRGKSESSDALRAILNAGYRKGTKVLRCGGKNEDFTPKQYETFCPKVIILIGGLPDTLGDRCISIHMRRHRNEKLARFRFATVSKEAAPLKTQMAEWTAANANKVEGYYQQHDVDFLSDREAELWNSLFAVLAVADSARLPELELTARRLSDAESVDESTDPSIRLLSDLRQLFSGASGSLGYIRSQELVNLLNEIEEAPWKDWAFGKGLSTRKLAALLHPYSIKPQNVRTEVKEKVVKAYTTDSFQDAWDRYLPTAGVTPAIAATVSAPQDAFNSQSPNGAGVIYEVTLGSEDDPNANLVEIDIAEDGEIVSTMGGF
jgi:hypothetical protein